MKNLLFLTLASVLLAVVACKKEQPCTDATNPACENYDPCLSKKPVTADFEIGQGFGWQPPKYLQGFHADVAFFRAWVGFQPVGYDAKDTSVKYTWLLGREVIHDFSFYRDFSDTRQTGENDIPITLIIEKKPDTACFPNDDGRDTLTKYIHFVESECEALVMGNFKVLFEGETDSVIVKTRNWYFNYNPPKILDSCIESSSPIYLDFDNSNPAPDTVWAINYGTVYYSKIIFIPGTGGGINASPRNGTFTVDPVTKKCKAEYQLYLHKGGLTPVKRFSGRKLN